MVCIVTDNFRKKNLRNSWYNVFYLTALRGESSFAADHVTELTFLSLLNEIYSLLLPVQCSCTNWSESKAVRTLFTGEVRATRRLLDMKHWGEWLEPLKQPERGVSESIGKRQTDDPESQKKRRQKKMSVSEKWLTARPVYAKDRGFSQAFLCSAGCQLKHAEEQKQSGVWAWSRTSWAEQKDFGG